MNKSIAKFILNIGNSIEGPTFIKDYEDSKEIINELKSGLFLYLLHQTKLRSYPYIFIVAYRFETIE